MFDDPQFLRAQLIVDRATLAQAEANLKIWKRLGKVKEAEHSAKIAQFWRTECAEAEAKLASLGIRV